MSVQYWAAKVADDDHDPHLRMNGVFLDKTGHDEEARRIFKRCAERGNLNAMP